MAHTTAELLDKISKIVPATPVDLSGIVARLDAGDAKDAEQDGRLSVIETNDTQKDARLAALEAKDTAQDAATAEVRDLVDKTVTGLVPD